MNASYQKKYFVGKISNYEKKIFSKFDIFPTNVFFLFTCFEFLEQFMIGTFLITLTQLEKTGSIGYVFNPLEILVKFKKI